MMARTLILALVLSAPLAHASCPPALSGPQRLQIGMIEGGTAWAVWACRTPADSDARWWPVQTYAVHLPAVNAGDVAAISYTVTRFMLGLSISGQLSDMRAESPEIARARRHAQGVYDAGPRVPTWASDGKPCACDARKTVIQGGAQCPLVAQMAVTATCKRL